MEEVGSKMNYVKCAIKQRDSVMVVVQIQVRI